MSELTSIQYVEPMFRPPSEAESLILQITNGCSWNRCTYCEMYTAPQKKFSAKKEDEIFAEIAAAAMQDSSIRRVFLADGDALVLSTRRLLAIIYELRSAFPNLNRISSYCLPRNIKSKSVAELAELNQAGLGLVYVGAESGDNELLALVDKGETYTTTVDALQKLREANIKTSVMILNGLGGKQYSEQHALNSARLVNATQPNFLATLVVSFPTGEKRFRKRFNADFSLLDKNELFREMETFIQHTELNKTIFRSDHASNYLILKGVLGKDKARLLEQIRIAQTTPENSHLRPDWQRGL